MDIKRTPDAQLRFLAGRVAEVMIQRIQNEVPKSGKFGNLSVSFKIPETNNKGVLLIEPSLTGTSFQRRLQIGARREGTDLLCSNYLINDTNENIIKFLQQDDIAEQLIPYYRMHSDKLNEE